MNRSLQLTLRTPSPIPIEVEGVLPERVEKLSLLDVAKLPVQHGNRQEELGAFFDVTGDSASGWVQFAGDTRNVKHIGAGLSRGTVYVENDAGTHAGARMSGGELVIDGSAGDWLGAEMRGGFIEVRHSSGDQTGAAYRGSRRGMTGGAIFIRGSAGDELGLLMRRGLIVVSGDCGEFAGASMIAGSVFILGEAGGRLGAGMKRGTIVAGRVAELPPSFRYSCDFRPSFLRFYAAKFREWEANPPDFLQGEMRCY
ncbi:MAG TPA: formylmethanofuran dehydrogenase subunit C, partial [Gemmataceae bacterium]|nr:formylmethanofuran dehydrogenase subunit C [Gemmataceae bacterium]